MSDCNSGYKSCPEKRTVYRFPANPVERQKWLDAIPTVVDHLKIQHLGVCILHWEDGFPVSKKGRYPSPAIPPNKWPASIPESCIRTPSAPRTTLNSTSKVRQESLEVNQILEFEKQDLFRLHEGGIVKFKTKFTECASSCGLLAYHRDFCEDHHYVLLSRKRTGSVHNYSVYFDFVIDDGTVTSMTYEGYFGVKRAVCTVSVGTSHHRTGKTNF